MEIKKDFDFWKDATSFIEEVIPKDIEEKITNHITESGFNYNEAALFRHYIVQAFDMKPMMAILKMKIKDQENEKIFEG